jgi:hypothetical protein
MTSVRAPRDDDTPPKAAPGWHKQPNGAHRFWDGEKWTDRKRNDTALWLIGAVAVLFAVVCATSTAGSDSDAGDTGTGDIGAQTSKYEQTWSKSYSETTCGEFMESMAPQQRSAAAADMLTGARNKGDGGEGLPPDRLIDEFESGLDTVCTAEATMSLADAGAGLYLTDRARFRP